MALGVTEMLFLRDVYPTASVCELKGTNDLLIKSPMNLYKHIRYIEIHVITQHYYSRPYLLGMVGRYNKYILV